MQVIPVIYDLILWLSAKVGKFPRTEGDAKPPNWGQLHLDAISRPRPQLSDVQRALSAGPSSD